MKGVHPCDDQGGGGMNTYVPTGWVSIYVLKIFYLVEKSRGYLNIFSEIEKRLVE